MYLFTLNFIGKDENEEKVSKNGQIFKKNLSGTKFNIQPRSVVVFEQRRRRLCFFAFSRPSFKILSTPQLGNEKYEICDEWTWEQISRRAFLFQFFAVA